MGISSKLDRTERWCHRYRRIERRVFEYVVMLHNVLWVCHDVWCFSSGSYCFMCVSWCFRMFYKCFIMSYMFHHDLRVSQWFTMFSESRDDRHQCLPAGICDKAAGNANNATGIGDNDTKVIPCKTPYCMKTGVTLFLEDNFQKGLMVMPAPSNRIGINTHIGRISNSVTHLCHYGKRTLFRLICVCSPYWNSSTVTGQSSYYGV